MRHGSLLVDLRTMRKFAQVDYFITALTSRGKLRLLTRMARNACFKGGEMVTTSRTRGHRGKKKTAYSFTLYTHAHPALYVF